MLYQRFLTALVMLPIVGCLIYLGGLPFALFIGLIAVVALYEYFDLMSHQANFPPLFKLLASGATMLILLNGYTSSSLFLFSAIVLLVFGGLLGGLWFDQQRDYLFGWALTVAGVLYLIWPLALLIALREHADGFWWIIFGAVAIWSCDTGAYFVGRALGGKVFGERRFSPKWSAKKTWEGFFGGVFLSFLLSFLAGTWLLELASWQAILLGLLIGPLSALGDLVESMIKRRMKVKDSSQLIPGHGGVLDRLDSVLFGVVVIYFFVQWVI